MVVLSTLAVVTPPWPAMMNLTFTVPDRLGLVFSWDS